MSNLTDLNFKPYLAEAPYYTDETSLDILQTEYGLDEIVNVGSNENPLPPSPLVVEAIQQATQTLNRYPAVMGDEDLRQALAGAIGQGLTADNFFSGNGGCDVLAMIATSFLSPGDSCIICRPTFPIYDLTARRAGATITYVDLEPDHFTYDVEAILAAITANTRLIYLCTPNNPTGTLLTADQMATLVNNVPPHVLIVSDEVYYHFADSRNFPDSLAFVRRGKNVAVIHSLSKVFGLAGLRLGYAIAPPEIATYLSRVRQPFHLSRLTIAAALAALNDKVHIDETIALVLAGRGWLQAQLALLGLRTWPSQANFVLFLPPFPAEAVAERLMQRGIIVRPLAGFYMPDHLRVTVGLPQENVRFIAGLKQVLAEMNRKST